MPFKDKQKNKECKLRHMKENVDYYKKKRDEHRKVIRTFLNDLKKCSSCEFCGESHEACLVFHHKDPKEKDGNIANAITYGWSLVRLKSEIEKCQVLCANCHMKLHFEAGI